MKSEKSASQPGLLGRRRALGLGIAAAVFSLARPALAGPSSPPRRVHLVNPHTGESFDDIYQENGEYLPDALRQLDLLLRDHATDKVHTIDRGLIDLLSGLQRRIDRPQPFHVVSAYRSPETNAAARRHNRHVARNSLHMHGKAVDVTAPNLDIRKLTRAAIAMEAGGVGAYPHANFVHLDVGPVRTW